jgi:YfiH family protein
LLRQNADGLTTYQFESLAREGLVHAVFTRLGGVSRGPFATLNVGQTVGDDPEAVVENTARVYARMVLDREKVVTPRQVHSGRVSVVNHEHAGAVIPSADGLVTSVPGLGLYLRFADCQPILLYDPVGHALGLIHAGWRGVAQAIARRAVETMQAAFGSRPRDLIAGLGPAIGRCCYTVGDNVASAMGYALPDWNRAMVMEEDGWHLDLSAANAQQLRAAGVRQIEQADLCTACNNKVFFSHRADNGLTGRFAVVAYLEGRTTYLADRDRGLPTPKAEVQDSDQPVSPHPPGLPPFQEILGSNS